MGNHLLVDRKRLGKLGDPLVPKRREGDRTREAQRHSAGSARNPGSPGEQGRRRGGEVLGKQLLAAAA